MKSRRTKAIGNGRRHLEREAIGLYRGSLQKEIFKMRRFLSHSVTGGCLIAAILTSFGQESAPKPEKAGERPMGETAAVRKRFLELARKANDLPEIKELKAKVEQAQREYAAAVEAAISKEDAEIAAKYKSLRERGTDRPGARRAGGSEAGSLSMLSPDERERLIKAQREAYFKPEVRAAREKRKAAKTAEEKDSADSAYREALQKATLDIDKSLRPVLEKLEEKKSPSPKTSDTN